MPLSDLIRNLNAEHLRPAALRGRQAPFATKDGRVFVHYANLRLESQFLPILETATGKVHGHAASLRVFGLASGRPLDPEAVFVLPTDDGEFVQLDRLVRTLHALNYLTHRIRGNLLLRVHPRHVASVPADHGLAFEEILRPCGLIPEQITLEIDTSRLEDDAHLFKAIHNYKARGYGIAVSHFGRTGIDFRQLETLTPDIVRFDTLLLSSTRPLKRLIDRIHELEAKVIIEGVDTAALRKGAAASQIDLLQAYSPLRRLIHASTPLEREQPSIRSAA